MHIPTPASAQPASQHPWELEVPGKVPRISKGLNPGTFFPAQCDPDQEISFATLWTAACQAPLSFTVSVCSNYCHLNRWCYVTISYSATPSPPVVNLSQHWGLSVESALLIRWPKYWSFSFSISPSSEYSGLISLVLTGLITLKSKGLSRDFSSTTIRKHPFFSAQPSLWSSFHICTWLLEKPYRPLSAKWCVCFWICCLSLS